MKIGLSSQAEYLESIKPRIGLSGNPNLITPIIKGGYSPILEVGGRSGRFNFQAPPSFSHFVGSGKSPMYRFETDSGDVFNYRLERDKQGGRWEENEYSFNTDLNMIKKNPGFAFRMWGRGPIAQYLIDAVAAGIPDDEIKAGLKRFNTYRQISGD